MADQSADLPPSPGLGKPPGWYQVDNKINHEAYWDGETWTARRRWNGSAWEDLPLSGTVVAPTPGKAAASSRRWLAIGAVVLVVGGALAAGLVLATSNSTRRSNGTSAPSPNSVISSTSTTSPVTVPHQSPAVVAACQSDAKSLEVALQAYMAQNGSFPTPPSAWSANTYDADFSPLTTSAHGGPYLHAALPTTNYVIEYDSSGNVWIAPPGSYEATFNAGQGFDRNPNICLAAAQ